MAVLRTVDAGSIFLMAAGAVANIIYIRQISRTRASAGRRIARAADGTSVFRIPTKIRRLTGMVAGTDFSP